MFFSPKDEIFSAHICIKPMTTLSSLHLPGSLSRCLWSGTVQVTLSPSLPFISFDRHDVNEQ